MWAVFEYAYDAEAIAMMPPAACSCRVAFLIAYKFTGKEHDTESGLDIFGARYDASSLGRFITPDPLFIALPRLSDPQLLNLYAYARNNPVKFTDSTGLDEKLDSSQVTGAQCAQTVTDLNNCESKQFDVTRNEKTGLLEASV